MVWVEESGTMNVFENDEVMGTADSNFVDDGENRPYLSDPNQKTRGIENLYTLVQ